MPLNSRFVSSLAKSAISPAISVPEKPPPATKKVSSRFRSAGSVSMSASSNISIRWFFSAKQSSKLFSLNACSASPG